LLLSVIVPVYNEERTILEVLRQVAEVPLAKEIIVVDDGSQDGTRDLLRDQLPPEARLCLHAGNRGKGAAVRTGLGLARGEVIIIQDADLEYDPQDYPALVRPIVEGRAQVVYGSRMLKPDNPRGGLPFYIGGRTVTLAANLLFGCRLTDEPTCYKVFSRRVLRGIEIESDGFEWEPEVTAKLLKKGVGIMEVPISYFPRGKAAGKKIRALDGAKAIWTLLKHRLRG